MILYPAGNSAVLYNNETKQQRFLNISEDSDCMTTLSVSSNKRLLAMGEKNKKGHLVSIWCLQKMTRKKSLLLSLDVKDDVISMSFSCDTKQLVVQGGKPNWEIYIYIWDKNKLVNSSLIIFVYPLSIALLSLICMFIRTSCRLPPEKLLLTLQSL